MKFKTQINNYEQLFLGLDNIIRIDLSKFDSSEVRSMKYMFKDCSNLESINFSNIKTSNEENMEGLFPKIIKLRFKLLS